MHESLSGRTLYEYMRCNRAPTANPVHAIDLSGKPRSSARNTLWTKSVSSHKPLQVRQEIAKKPAPLQKSVASDLSAPPVSMVKQAAPPMFESSRKERRGTRLSHLKGTSPGQLGRRIEKKLARRISRQFVPLLSINDLHKAVLSVDLAANPTQPDDDEDALMMDEEETLEEYKSRQSHVLLMEAMEGFFESLNCPNLYQTVFNVHIAGAVRKGREWSVLTLKQESTDYRIGAGDVLLLFKESESPLLQSILQKGVAKADWTLGSDLLFGIAERNSSDIGAKLPLASPEFRFGYSPSDCAVGSQWTAVVVHSLLTVEREWRALVELNSIPKMIISPEVHSKTVLPKFCDDLNFDQQSAIRQVLSPAEIVLIQGPPGTGKTHTLVSLLRVLEGKKVLIAAPSNAAVDELMARFVAAAGGKRVVRIGRFCREDLKKFSLDFIVSDSQAKETTAQRAEYKDKKTKMISDIVRLGTEIASAPHKGDLIRARDRLKQNVDSLETRQVDRDAIYRKILNEKNQFIFGTLSAFGSDSVWNNLNVSVDVCVVDEAAQAIEVSTLIPLKFQPKKLVLVGDPQQLPAVVKSHRAKRIHRFDLSLMERLMLSAPNAVNLLREQYRMHPEIAEFPSKMFYDGMLLTKNAEKDDKFSTVWGHTSRVVFVDVPSSTDMRAGTSMMNPREARICVDLVNKLIQLDPALTIGVIAPYKKQVLLLRSLFTNQTGVEVDSVDAFQGREKDVIVFNCVRTSGTSVGFLADQRRLNVAITRAKKGLVIVGNATHLRNTGGPVWASLIQHCPTI